jgi:hypothetical protein
LRGVALIAPTTGTRRRRAYQASDPLLANVKPI